MSVLKDVRLHCLDCCCGIASEVKNCQIKTCHLWPYRMGKDTTRTPLNDRRTEASCGRTAQIGSYGKEIID